jgi:hypothetical protein
MAKKRTVDTGKPVDALTKLWKEWTPSQKKALLKARGLSTTWAKTKTIEEMVKRGGGMVAKDLLNLMKTYNKRKGSKKVTLK